VVARCLLLDKKTPVTIPCCSDCNNSKAREDEYLRDTFAVRIETSELTDLAEVKSSAMRSALRPHSPPIVGFLEKIEAFPKFDDRGNFIGLGYRTRANPERMYRAFTWIARGLYFHHLGRNIDVSAEAHLHSNANFQAIWHKIGGNGPFDVGNSLSYKFLFDEAIPSFSEWHFYFYKSVYVILTLNHRSLIRFTRDIGMISPEECELELKSLPPGAIIRNL